MFLQIDSKSKVFFYCHSVNDIFTEKDCTLSCSNRIAEGFPEKIMEMLERHFLNSPSELCILFCYITEILKVMQI